MHVQLVFAVVTAIVGVFALIIGLALLRSNKAVAIALLVSSLIVVATAVTLAVTSKRKAAASISLLARSVVVSGGGAGGGTAGRHTSATDHSGTSNVPARRVDNAGAYCVHAGKGASHDGVVLRESEGMVARSDGSRERRNTKSAHRTPRPRVNWTDTAKQVEFFKDDPPTVMSPSYAVHLPPREHERQKVPAINVRVDIPGGMLSGMQAMSNSNSDVRVRRDAPARFASPGDIAGGAGADGADGVGADGADAGADDAGADGAGVDGAGANGAGADAAYVGAAAYAGDAHRTPAAAFSLDSAAERAVAPSEQQTDTISSYSVDELARSIDPRNPASIVEARNRQTRCLFTADRLNRALVGDRMLNKVMGSAESTQPFKGSAYQVRRISPHEFEAFNKQQYGP